ncbi:hypothetical protein GCM10020331_091360 [Ectobacillus funiculus]
MKRIKTVLERMEGKPVVVRTLDIGGDKELSYLDLPKEMNPFFRVSCHSIVFNSSGYVPYAAACVVACKHLWKFEKLCSL